MKHLFYCTAAIFIAVLCAAKAPGQEKSPDPPESKLNTLSLADARKIALSQNWDLLAAKSGMDATEAQKIIAGQFPNPELSLDVSGINLDGRSNTYDQPLTRGQEIMQSVTLPGGQSGEIFVTPTRKNGIWDRTYDTVIAVSQLIELGGKRMHRVAAANAGAEAAAAQFEDARRILDTAVITAYGDVLLALANVRILNDSAESMREEARLAGLREKAGDISATDRSQIEVEADRLGADARSAEAAAVQARLTLTTLLGLDVPNADWTPVEDLDALANLPAPALPDEGRERPDLLAAKALADKAEAELRGQRALKIPDPTVSVGYEHEPPDGPNTIGFGISVPIPAWHRYGGEVKAAEIACSDARRDIRKVAAQVAAERTQAQSAYSSARERWHHFRGEIQPKSLQIRENISFAYRKGGATLLDLLSAQRTHNEARTETAQSAADTLAALADLSAAFNVSLDTGKEDSK
jgi:cobalt-zinc-cadmium efflux system outer membrane protein